MSIIAQGAEARIYKTENTIVKDRFSKSYRHPEIDTKLRKSRTRHEVKILSKLQQINFPSPRVRKADEDKGTLEMEFIHGELVKNIFNKNHEQLATEIGGKIAQLHANDIIHGDLTTSNMIFDKEIHIIDFGLSFFSLKIEDKAVDLHLLDRALESKHHEVYPQCMKSVLEAYQQHGKDAEQVIKRYQDVKRRGRNKEKY